MIIRDGSARGLLIVSKAPRARRALRGGNLLAGARSLEHFPTRKDFHHVGHVGHVEFLGNDTERGCRISSDAGTAQSSPDPRSESRTGPPPAGRGNRSPASARISILRASGRFAAAGHGFRAWESNARNPGPPARRSALGNPRCFRRDFPLRPRVPPSRTGPRPATWVGCHR